MTINNKQTYKTRIPENSNFKRCWWPHPLFSDILQVEYSEDPDIVFLSAPGSHSIGKVNCKTGEILWIVPSIEANGISYHPRAKKVIAADRVNNQLIEYDSETGKAIRSFDKTELGPMGKVWGVHYIANYATSSSFDIYGWRNSSYKFCEDPDLVAIADTTYHIAGVLKLSSGRFKYYFGEYGVAGDDNKHLHSPRDISLWANYGAWIADYSNHRLVHLDLTKNPPEINYKFIFPSPSCVRYTFDSPNADCFSASAVISTEDFYQPLTLILSDFNGTGLEHYTSLIGSMPIASNIVTFNPHNPLLISVNQWSSVFEVAWDKSSEQFRHLRRFSKHYLTHQLIAKSKEWVSPPVIGLLNEKMRIKIYSSKAMDAFIESPEPKFRLLAVPPDFQWKTVEPIRCREDQITCFLMEAPLDVYRIKIKPQSEDTLCSVYVEGY